MASHEYWTRVVYTRFDHINRLMTVWINGLLLSYVWAELKKERRRLLWINGLVDYCRNSSLLTGVWNCWMDWSWLVNVHLVWCNVWVVDCWCGWNDYTLHLMTYVANTRPLMNSSLLSKSSSPLMCCRLCWACALTSYWRHSRLKCRESWSFLFIMIIRYHLLLLLLHLLKVINYCWFKLHEPLLNMYVQALSLQLQLLNTCYK